MKAKKPSDIEPAPATVVITSRGGRPKIVVDESVIEEMAMLDYTIEEIAAEVGCHRDTINARFSAPVKRGREKGNGSLKRRMWKLAMSGNLGMLVWLSKQRLGYRDRQPEEAAQIHFHVMVNEVPK